MSEIKIVTFKGFLSVIGEVSELFESVVIKQPCQVVLQNSPETGQVSVGFVPLMAVVENWSTGITFPKSEVLSVNEAVLDLRNNYSEAFGSGLTIARNVPGKIQTK